MEKAHVKFNEGSIIPCVAAGPNVTRTRYFGPQEFMARDEAEQCECCKKEVIALRRNALMRRLRAA